MTLTVNSMEGTIPSSLGSLTKLTDMNFFSNGLKGTIPFSLGSLAELTSLVLARNSFKGTIPASLGLLTKLTTIDLRSNTLTGRVPPLPFKQYTDCDLGGTESFWNQFKCPLPAGSEQCEGSRLSLPGGGARFHSIPELGGGT
jgi:hypothetical protein